MKTKFFSQRIITDPTLIFGKQLQLEFVEGITQKEVLSSFNFFLDQVMMFVDDFNKFQKEKLQVVIVYPVAWLDFEKKLMTSGWKKSLVNFEYLLKNLGTAHIKNNLEENGFVISKNVHSFLELQLLLEQQAEYHSKKYPEYYKNVSHISWKKYEKITMSDLLHNSAHNLFLLKDSKIVGLILSEVKGTTATAYEFIIDEDIRGQGVGTQFLSQYLLLSKQADLQCIALETWWDQPSRKLYERLGFVAVKSECYLNFQKL